MRALASGCERIEWSVTRPGRRLKKDRIDYNPSLTNRQILYMYILARNGRAAKGKRVRRRCFCLTLLTCERAWQSSFSGVSFRPVCQVRDGSIDKYFSNSTGQLFGHRTSRQPIATSRCHDNALGFEVGDHLAEV